MIGLCVSVLVPASQIPVLAIALCIHCFSSRSSHRRCSVRKGVLRNFAKFTGKHLCQSLFFNEVTGLGPATLLEKRLWHRYFPVNFVKFLRTLFYRTLLGDCFCSASCQKTNIHEPFHTVTFHHDAPNSHVPGINFFKFLVHARSITSYHS